MARRRAHGPYKHGQHWRVITVNEVGARGSQTARSQDEANAFIEDFLAVGAERQGITVGNALNEYEVAMRKKGNKPRSVDTTRGRIARLLADDFGKPLLRLTESRCAKLYADLHDVVSVDYHRNALNETRTFLNWCMAKPRQWIKRNPVKEVKGEGKRKRGKPQLRIDESRLFEAKCFELHAQGKIAGAVGIGALHLGTRITEMVSRPVRDLDDDGWLLWIPDSKTESGRRKLEIPADLRGILLKLAKGKQPHEPLFRGRRGTEHITRHSAYRMVKETCALAGVPIVSPHGLRGTHASIARVSGATPALVAAAIGHKSYDAVTARNYVAPGTDEGIRQRTVMNVLQGGRR